MTEDEAKAKWCPFARVPFLMDEMRDFRTEGLTETVRINSVAVSANRRESGNIPSAALCTGSACMAWQATNSHAGRARDVSVKRHPGAWLTLADVRPQERHNERHPGEWEIERPRPSGYCGLAGQSQ